MGRLGIASVFTIINLFSEMTQFRNGMTKQALWVARA
jgi:hypothetical protein